jgi:hypothetical protein
VVVKQSRRVRCNNINHVESSQSNAHCT